MPSSLGKDFRLRVLHELRREIISFVFDFEFVWTHSILLWVYQISITTKMNQICVEQCTLVIYVANEVDSRDFSKFKLSFSLLIEVYYKHINSTCVWLQPLLCALYLFENAIESIFYICCENAVPKTSWEWHWILKHLSQSPTKLLNCLWTVLVLC